MKTIMIMGQYHQILVELGRWKVISMNSLYEQGFLNQSYQVFTKKVRKLEKAGLIKSILGIHKRKILSLTNEGAKYSPTASKVSDQDETLFHDLIATNVVTSLTKEEIFKFGEVPFYDELDEVSPDGIVYGLKNNKNYSMALEIELTQKSKKRIIDKFNKYSRSKHYHYSMYVFNKESAYRSYKNVLESMNDEIKSKIILCLDKELKTDNFDYMNSKIWFKSQDKSFKEVFFA